MMLNAPVLDTDLTLIVRPPLTFVLVAPGITISSPLPGTHPQLQFAAVLKLLSPALAKVQIAAYVAETPTDNVKIPAMNIPSASTKILRPGDEYKIYIFLM